MSELRSAILLLVVSLGFTVPAAAQDSGFYALASVGNADTEYGRFARGSDDAWQLGAGYAFSDRLSIELSYHDFGEVVGFGGCPPEVLCLRRLPPEDVQIDGWSGQLVGSLPLVPDLSLFAKAGWVGWEISAARPSLRDSGDGLIYSAGLHWAASQRIALQASYEEVDLDIAAAKVGLVFRF